MRPIVWPFLLTFAYAAAAHADSPTRIVSDRVAIEAVSVFKGACVDHAGDLAAIQAVIDGSGKDIHVVPADQVREMHSGRAGGTAWGSRTPNGGRIILSLDPIGVCALYIQKVDGLSLHNAVLALLDHLAETESIRYREMEDTMSAVSGGDRRYASYLIAGPRLDQNVIIAVSSTNSEKTALQGFLTYGATNEPF